jgi:hypothetical protein
VIPVEDAARVELEAIAWRDGPKRKRWRPTWAARRASMRGKKIYEFGVR